MKWAQILAASAWVFLAPASSFAQEPTDVGGANLTGSTWASNQNPTELADSSFGPPLKPGGAGVAETLSSATDVSGTFVVGLVSEGGDAPSKLIRVDHPRAGAALCVKVVSIDGAYSAQAEYRLTSRPVPITLLEFPAAKLAGLRIATTELAISATYQSSCAAPPGLLAIAFWLASRSDRIGVAVNPGAGMRAYFYRQQQDGAAETVCDDLSAPRPPPARRAIVYTAVCWTTARQLAAAPGLTIHTSNDQGEGPSATVAEGQTP